MPDIPFSDFAEDCKFRTEREEYPGNPESQIVHICKQKQIVNGFGYKKCREDDCDIFWKMDENS